MGYVLFLVYVTFSIYISLSSQTHPRLYTQLQPQTKLQPHLKRKIIHNPVQNLNLTQILTQISNLQPQSLLLQTHSELFPKNLNLQHLKLQFHTSL